MARVKRPALTDEEFEAARKRGELEMANGARSVRFDHSKGTVVITMRSGAVALIPWSLIPIVSGEKRPRVVGVELSPLCTTLRFPQFDADFSIRSLVRHAFGMNEGNKIAGSTKSAARAAASRRNGRKGGRPKKSA